MMLVLRQRLSSLRQSTLVRQSALGIILQGVGKGFAFCLTLVLARLLQVSEFGAFAYARNWIFLLGPLATLGYAAAASRFVPAYLSHGHLGEAQAFTRHALAIVLIAGASLSGLIISAVAIEPDFFGASYRLVLLTVLPATPFYAILYLFMSLGRAFGLTVLAYAPLLVLQPVLHFAFFAIAYALGAPADAFTATASFTSATVFVCAASLLWLGAALPASTTRLDHCWRHREWFAFALPTTVTLAASIALSRFPTIAVGLLATNAEVGRFAVALAFAQIIAIPRDALAGTLLPEMSRRLAEGNVPGLRRLLWYGVSLTVAASSMAALVLWTVGEYALELLGASFSGARSILGLLIIDQLLLAAAIPLSGFITVASRPAVNVRILCVSAAFCVVLSVAFAAQWGAIGAALGTVAGGLVLLLGTLRAFFREWEVICRTRFPQKVGATTADSHARP